MVYYSNRELSDSEMSRNFGASCVGYGAGESHERIIQQAGGEIGYDGFKDPRPNQEGNIKADRVFINQQTNTVQGINFTKDGEFCCSYTGHDYDEIKNSNRYDCENKKIAKNNDKDVVYDEYGVVISKEHNENCQQQGYGLKR